MRVVPLCTFKSARHDCYITGKDINQICLRVSTELGCSGWILANLFWNEMDRGRVFERSSRWLE